MKGNVDEVIHLSIYSNIILNIELVQRKSCTYKYKYITHVPFRIPDDIRAIIRNVPI